MRRGHFAALRPVCVVCRTAPLALTHDLRSDDDQVHEGILGCTNDQCLREYPIVDGIPILVAAIRAWAANNPLQLLLRDDLSPELESLFGDAMGPGSPFDSIRQRVSIYASDHYDGGGAAFELLSRAPVDAVDGPMLDTGCSVGGITFALAERYGRMTLGVDLDFSMLRVAARAAREGRVRYARRRIGLVYDRVDRAVELPGRELADFWCCDVAALPFADPTFALAASLNVLDCVGAPRDAVAELARILLPGGTAIVSTPYDWSASATPIEQWLGGHSQRGPGRGAAEPLLRKMIGEQLSIVAEEESVPWLVRLHERSAVEYAAHLIVARRIKGQMSNNTG